MVADLIRSGAELVLTPFLATARFVQRQASGPRCVLDVPVSALPDVRVRTVWLDRLRRAAADPSVVALLLRLDGSPGSWAATGDLRATLQAIRGAGTRVYAVLQAPGTGAVYLASACDHVFMLPTGQLGLLGVGAELTFFGAALQNLGVEPDFEAAGAYKSFGEPYTRSYASPAYQEAVGLIVEDLQAQLVDGIAQGRDVDATRVRHALARAPLSAQEAIAAGLVDTLAYEDEVRDWLKEHHGKGLRVVEFTAWSRRDVAVERLESVTARGPAIAVVHLDGPIVMEEGGRGTAIRARKVVEILRRIRLDDQVRGVVLHVNSPGGSALASDVIWREVDLLAQDKTVVASFEDVAASGGYYLAAPAHEIVARRGTLTGSIGVFGGKLVVGEGLRKLGVHTHQLGGSPNSHVYSPTRPFTGPQRERFRAMLQRTYDGFVERVARGRRVSVDQVEPHCRGRVWTGEAALERGLIDSFGTLDDAIERARVLAEVPGARRVDVNTLPRRSALQWALQKAMPSAARVAVPPGLQTLSRLVPHAALDSMSLVMDHPAVPLALLSFQVEVR